jgi:hypothetical protein
VNEVEPCELEMYDDGGHLLAEVFFGHVCVPICRRRKYSVSTGDVRTEQAAFLRIPRFGSKEK